MNDLMAEQRAQRRGHSRASRELGGALLATVALAIFFASVPLSVHGDGIWWLLALAAGSSLLLGLAVVRMVVRGPNLLWLLNLVLLVVVVLSLTFYTVATNLPDQFSGLETRIDALYFTLTTMTTTGYGDIHAVGQLARLLVSLAFVFDLVFLGLLGAELSRLAGRGRSRAEERERVASNLGIEARSRLLRRDRRALLLGEPFDALPDPAGDRGGDAASDTGRDAGPTS